MAAETLYIIRHATPDWERKDLEYHLPPGPPLTELGRLEASALGAFLLAAGVKCLHSSPLERALHTAQIAGTVAGAAVHVDERLIEWQPNETQDGVRHRVLEAVDRLVQPEDEMLQTHQSRWGLVTHGGPIAMLMLGLGMDESWVTAQRRFDRMNPSPPAGVWEAWRESPSQPWRLRLAFVPNGIEVAN